MKVGYAILYEDGTLTISKKHTILQKPIYKDYGEFDDMNIPWINNYAEIKIVKILGQVKSNNMNSWFENCYNLSTLIDFENLDVSDCKDFSYVFHGCELLTEVSALKNWNVVNGKIFECMFTHCYLLKDISALSNWNVSNGEDFSLMFCECGLTDLSALINWDVSKGRNFFAMFRCCESLTDISNIQNWNVSNREDFTEMFMYCNLKSVFIDTWTISRNKKYINNMFACNESLTNIYIPNTFEQINDYIFHGCNEKLKIHWKDKIYIYDDLKEYQEF